jgi:hypothetical protein
VAGPRPRQSRAKKPRNGETDNSKETTYAQISTPERVRDKARTNGESPRCQSLTS